MKKSEVPKLEDVRFRVVKRANHWQAEAQYIRSPCCTWIRAIEAAPKDIEAEAEADLVALKAGVAAMLDKMREVAE